MNLDALTSTTGEWLRGTGAESDIVISTRIRLAIRWSLRPWGSTAQSPHACVSKDSLR